MEKILYLMRHGQTLFNLKGRIQGSSDSPLTDLGVQQAQAAGHYFTQHQIKFDSAVSSTQERASDTLEHAIPGQPYTRLKGLKEWSFGLFEGESIQLLRKIKQPGVLYGDYVIPFGGEARQAVQTRMIETLTQVMEHDSQGCTLAVSHGSTIGVFLDYWVEREQFFEAGNCHILKFSYKDGAFKFIEVINPINDN